MDSRTIGLITYCLILGAIALLLVRWVVRFRCSACSQRCNPFFAGTAFIEGGALEPDKPAEIPVCRKCKRSSPGKKFTYAGRTYLIEGGRR